MANKKKNSTPPEQEIHIYYICGKEIHGDHVYIKTKRRTELRIHFECVKNPQRGVAGKIGGILPAEV